jgi:hypothetical protein
LKVPARSCRSCTQAPDRERDHLRFPKAAFPWREVGPPSINPYAQHRPNLGNHEGNCPSLLLADDPPAAIGAVDALRPDQQAMLAEFADHAASDAI